MNHETDRNLNITSVRHGDCINFIFCGEYVSDEFEWESWRSIQIYISGKDRETIWHIINESGLPDDQKTRLKRKMSGEFLSDKTYSLGMAARKRNAVRRRQRMGNM